ncbi:hypothetical protein EJC49_05390 [Aquibium carbonis]|uniref:DUF6644 domain-containing protein n=1 Tax=Aquibium carbonis TaxID=2495581 RepID=A0A3S0A2N6_9HYPH|nr:DUF6644 family protein [Aquibium carbonis]RST87448.1 hypothetical protein EJC49_05390 [Aquibium carbonis]
MPLLDVLRAIEGLPPAVALRTSFVAYPMVNALHILSIGMLVAAVMLMDLRVLGRLSRLDGRAFVATMRPVAGFAFFGAVLTGVALFSIRASEYAFNPAFQVKLALIALAGVNLALFLRAPRHSGLAGQDGFSAAERLSAVASLVLWPAALVAGRFIGFL